MLKKTTTLIPGNIISKVPGKSGGLVHLWTSHQNKMTKVKMWVTYFGFLKLKFHYHNVYNP